MNWFKKREKEYTFKEGDFIAVKPNTKLASGEVINNWAGQILELDLKNKVCLVKLDAKTIDSISDDYLKSGIEKDATLINYIFEFKHIELSARRDTDEELREALNKFSSRIMALEFEPEDECEEDYKKLTAKWISAFICSKFHETLGEEAKEVSIFVPETFMDFMYNHADIEPSEWTPENVSEICVDVVPRKITSGIEVFMHYGEVLIQFLGFLGNEKCISNSKALIEAVEGIENDILKEASDPSNLDVFKSMTTLAQEAGFDLSKEDDMNDFNELLGQINEMAVPEIPSGRVIPLGESTFKSIGRNQKITVQYKDGKVVKDVKFKKVESDLRDGHCKILK